MVAHQFVFALGVELIAWDVTPNVFFGCRFLVGFRAWVVLPHFRIGRRDHDHRRPCRRLGLLERLLDGFLLFRRKVLDHLFGRDLGFLLGSRGFFCEDGISYAQGKEGHQSSTNEAGRCHLPACYAPNVSAW